MSENALRLAFQRAGCRLCLAPDTECVPIFATAAADKEPLSNKILSCVNIKVQQADRMSNRICHACISFLNSWQSFKNRCNAAQKKQQNLLDMWLAKERPKKTIDSTDRLRQLQQQQPNKTNEQRILKSALMQSANSTPFSNGSVNNSSIDVSFIKEEPEEVVSDDEEMNAVDPTQFLAQDDDLGDDAQPPLLASLGLTHINHTNDGDTTANSDDPLSMANRLLAGKSQAACTICNMQFSNRANARRHERNIHGIKIDLLYGNSTILPPKDRLQFPATSINPVAAAAAASSMRKRMDEPVMYDYSKPEQYRHLLTEPRLNFIRQHMEFLDQYQTMTCKCCNKQFPTYKFFMAHMRKKYDTLSRNLCFKCLKQFQTKPQFIAHLKKRNCLNLYKVFLTDDTIPKDPLPSAPPRYGSKEIIANKTYGCRLCTETFRLKSDFRSHVLDSHNDAQKREIPGATHCGYCNLEFEDANVRRRHFNNVECMVFLMCGTCNERFDTHPAYIEHVYATHIPTANATPIKNELLLDADDDNGLMVDEGSLSRARNPQNCKVCGKQYNNYYNVLRHMESKHPDQLPDTYRCDICDQGYPRQVELREHMFNVHGQSMKIKREIFNCRGCNNTFESKEIWLAHQSDEHGEFFCHLCDYEADNRDDFESHLLEHTKAVRCTICQHSFSSDRSLETHLSVVHNMTRAEMPADTSLNSDDEDDAVPVECAVDIQVNGDDETYEDDAKSEEHDGNEADNDETMENPAKRQRLNEDADQSISSPQLNSTCRVCKQTFDTRAALIIHMRTAHSSVRPSLPPNAINTSPTQVHNVNNRLRCRICQKRIHTKNGYKRHMLQMHQVKDCIFIKCKLCPSEFSNDKGLKVHMFRTHNITVQQMQEDESLLPIPKQESTSITTPTMPLLKQMFECDICHTVYRNREQLRSHKSVVHKITDTSITDQTDGDEESFISPLSNERWFQCRYCDESFNASKKLTIHMHNHSEYDHKQTTCKDCGNVYGTRKSLWVHRQKKHPRIPNPSPCELCGKTFFDKTELLYHLKTHSNDDVFSHLQEMQEQLEAEQRVKQANNVSQQETFSCHICSKKFQDKRVLSKHLRQHELQKQQNNVASGGSLFDNSPLAAMLADTNIGKPEQTDYNYPSYKGQMVDGRFACDMCPKTFPLMTALKVHRGWHFRSPDGRQITDSNNIWHPDSVPPSKGKRSRSSNPPVCPFCNSTFASGNNLRRHIVEVHKRNEAKLRRGNGADDVFIEKECECQACGITFNNRSEWVDHKISHARTMKPSTTYEWGCEICGKVFTRKERLLVHMLAHLNSKEDDQALQQGRQSELGFESNSQSSMSSQSQSQQSLDSNQMKAANQLLAKQSVSLLKPPSLLIAQQQKHKQQPRRENIETSIKIEDNNDSNSESGSAQKLACDLCSLYFNSSKELRAHVISHINGPEAGAPFGEGNDSKMSQDEEYDDDGVDEGDSIDGENVDEDFADDAEEADVDDAFDEDDEIDGEVGGEDEDGEEQELSEAEEDDDDDIDESDHEQVQVAVPKKSHQKTRLQETPTGFNCRVCGSSSESHLDMIQCMENHNRKSEIQCEICQLYFTRESQLQEHERLCHPKNFDDEDEDEEDDDDVEDVDEDDDDEDEENENN